MTDVATDIVEPLQDEENVYELVLAAATAADPEFKAQFAKESDQEYLTRLLDALSPIEDEPFKQLPYPVQHWFEVGARAFNEDAPVPAPAGFVSAFTSASKSKTKASASESGVSKGRGRPKGSTNKPKANKTPKAARPPRAAKPPKVAKEAAPRAKTSAIAIREAVVRNPLATAAEITASIEAEGFNGVNATTVMTIRYDTLATLRVVRDLGKLHDVDLGKYGYTVVQAQ